MKETTGTIGTTGTGALGRKSAKLGWAAAVGIAAAGMLLGGARGAWANWGDTCYWRNEATSSDWDSSSWYNASQDASWGNHNPGYVGGNKLIFDNTNHPTMQNSWGSPGSNLWQVIFNDGTPSRTITGTVVDTFYDNGGTMPKIENYTTVNQTINFPFIVGYSSGMEINPVNGNLLFKKRVSANGHAINVYGSNGKTAYFETLSAGNHTTYASTMTLYVDSSSKVSIGQALWGGPAANTWQDINVKDSAGYVTVTNFRYASRIKTEGAGTVEFNGQYENSGGASIWIAGGTTVLNPLSATVCFTNVAVTNGATLVLHKETRIRRVTFNSGSTVQMDVLSTNSAALLGVNQNSGWTGTAYSFNGNPHTLKLVLGEGSTFNAASNAAFTVYEARSGGSLADVITNKITLNTTALGGAAADTNKWALSLTTNKLGSANAGIKLTYTAPQTQAAVGLATTTFNYNGSAIKLTPNGGSGTGAYSIAKVSGGTGTGTFNASTTNLTVTAAGTFLFDVTRAASGNYAARTDRVTVTVNKGTQAAVTLSTTTFNWAGSALTLSGSGGSSGGAYSYEYGANGTGSGSVSSGKLTATAAGTMTVNVTCAGNNLWNSRTDTVTVTVNKGTQASLGVSLSTSTYAGSAITLTGSGGSGSGGYSFSVPAEWGSVSGTALTLSKAGSVPITVTKAGDALWNAKSETINKTVNKGTQAAVGLATTTFTYSPSGNTLEGNGGSGTGAFSYTYKAAGTGSGSVAGSTLSVTAVGNMTVTVTKAADSLWNSKSADVLVTVNKASQTVEFSEGGNPAMVTAGKSTSVAATVTSPATGGGAVTFSGNNDAVATVESGGSVTGVGAGQVTITATAAETDFYSEATEPYVLTVRAAGPTTVGSITSVSEIGSDTFKVVYARGNGQYAIMFAQTGSAPAVPEDGKGVNGTVTSGATNHIHRLALSSALAYPYGGASDGTKAILNNKVTTDLNWVFTGATPATHYFLALYERNPNQNSGSSATNWSYSATASTADFWTLSTEPTGNPAMVTPTEGAGTLGSGSATINWTKGTGANNTLVVIYGPADSSEAASALAVTAPTDGQVYSGSALGGTVLHAGTGTSAVASGLTKLKWYKVVAYSFAMGADNSTANYLTPGASITFKTLDSNGPLVWATGVDETSFLLNWTNLVDAANGFAVQVKTDAGTFSSQTDVADESFTSAEGWTAGDPGSSYAANSGTWKFNNCTVQPTGTGMGDTGYVYVSAVGSTVETPLMHDAVSHVEVQWRNGAGGRKVRVDVDRNGDGDYSDTGEQGVCVWTNAATSGCQTNFLYFASPRTSTSGIRIRFYNLGLTGDGSGNTIYIHRVKVGAHRGFSQLVDGLTDGSTYEARVQNAPNASDWSDVLTVKAGVVPTGLATGAVTRGSAAFTWSGANSPTGYRWQATTNAATGWTNLCTDGDTLTGADARSLYTNAFKTGRQWMYIGTTVGNPEHAPGGSVNDTPRYIVHQGGAHYLSGKAGLGIQSTNFPIAGATNIQLSYTIVNWNLGITGASAEMGRVDAYYRLDDGPWCYLGTGLNPNTGDGQTLAQTFTLDKGYLDGTTIAFKVVAPNAGHGTYSGADRLVGPGIQALEVKAQGGLGDYTTLFAEGTDSGSATVEGLDGNCPVYFRVQALQGSSVRSVWVETESRTSNLLGPTPSVEGTGRHEVTASWDAYDGEDAGDYNISYKVQLTGCASGGEPEEVSACPASGRDYGSSTTEWTYQRAYSGGTASSYPSWSSPWHRLWGQFASTTVYPGLESPEMDLRGYEKGYVEFSHNYINQKTNSEVALYYKVGDGSWTKWADTPRAQYSAAANATKRNIELPDEVIGQTRVKVKLVAWKAVNYDSDPDPEVTSYMVQGASVFGARVMAQGAGGGDYTCSYTSDEYTTTGTSFTFNAETMAGDSQLTGLMAGSNYYVHVQTVLTPKAGGAATTSEWGEDGNGTTAAPQLPPAEVWAEDVKQQHLTVGWAEAEGANEDTLYWVQLASSSCTPTKWSSVGVQPSATNADLTADDDWTYIGGGTEVDAVDGVKGTETNWITGRGVYPAWASIKQGAAKGEWSQVLAGEGAPGIESASFSTVGATNATLSFGHGRWFAHRADAGPATVLSLYYSTDGGGSWNAWANTTTTAVEFAYNNVTNFALPTAALGKSDVKVRIVAEAGDIGYSTNNATVKHARGAAVTAAKVTLQGARGDYENCLMRSVAGLRYDELSQVFGDLTNSTLYYFRVAASDGTQYGEWVDGSATTLAAPGTPGAPWQTSAGRTSLTMAWAPVEGAEAYTLALLTGNGGAVSATNWVEGTTFTWTGLTAGNTYYFKVMAHADGTSSAYGAQGSGTTAAALTAPEVTATNITLGSIRFQWPVDNEATYTVKFGPTTAAGTGADEILAAPMTGLKRSDAGNGWFYIGGNADYPKYFASGTDATDCGHVLAYTSAGSPGLQSRWFSTRGAKSATVEFLQGRYGNSGKNSAVDVYYSTDYGATWTLAGSAAATNAPKPTVARTIALPAAALDKRAVSVRVVAPEAASANAYGAELKDLKVRVAAGAQDSWESATPTKDDAAGIMYVTKSSLEAGTRYGISVVATSTTDSSVAGTTNSAATRMRRTGVTWSQGFEGSPAAYGAFDPAGKALTCTVGYYAVSGGADASGNTPGTGRPVVEVVEGVNPMYGDKALRMSGSKNASAFGVADFTGVNFGNSASESVTVTIPFAAQDLGANDYLYVAWANSTDNGSTWTWHAPGTTDQTSMGSIPLTRIGKGGGDVMNRNWPYNRGTNATTRPKGDAYSFRIDGLAGRLKIRVAFCGQSGGAARYYWIDEVSVSRNPGMVTGQSATAKNDGTVDLAWSCPSEQYTIIIRGQDMRNPPASVDLNNLPDGYELVTVGDTYAFEDGVTEALNDATADSGWRYYYYFYGALRNEDGSYTLSDPVSAWAVVKGTVHAIASMGWDGWDAHPWAYQLGRTDNPGHGSDYGWWKAHSMNTNPACFHEGEFAKNDATYSGYSGGSNAQISVTTARSYFGNNALRLSGCEGFTYSGTHVWTDNSGNVRTNTNPHANTTNSAIQFANVDLSGYKNVQFQMHFAATNMYGGHDLHVAFSTSGGEDTSWFGVGNKNESGWEVVYPTGKQDYGERVSDGDSQLSGDWDFYFQDSAKATPYGNPYVVNVPDSVTQLMVRITYFDSDGGDRRRNAYFIDEVRLLGEVAMETPKPVITDNGKTALTVRWAPVPDAEGYNVKITAVPSNGVVKLAEPFAQSVTPDGWTNSSSGVQYPSTASRSQAADDYGLKLSGNNGMAVSPEVGAATNVTFWARAWAEGSGKLIIKVKPMGSDSWETLKSYTATVLTTNWVQYSVALPYRQWQQVAFVRTGSQDFSIDDVAIYGAGDYRAVTSVAAGSYSSGVRGVTGVTETNFTYTGLTAGTRYFVEVQAYGNPHGVATTSGWGETADYTTGDFFLRADGFEMTRSTWAAPGSGSAILVMAVPEGQAYTNVVAPTNTAKGGINGTGLVLTNSTAAVSGAGLEHVRPYGSRVEDYEAKYVVYWKRGSYWEGRLETNVVLGTYVCQAADAIAVTNLTTGANLGTYSADEGKGWSGGWSVWDNASSYVSVTTGTATVTGTYTNWGLLGTNKLVGAGGNMIHFDMFAAERTNRVYRRLATPITNGTAWIMATVRAQYVGDEDNKKVGIQLTSRSDDPGAGIFASYGKLQYLYGGAPRLQIATNVVNSMPGAGGIAWSGETGDYTYNLADFGTGTGHQNSSGAHTLVLKYDIDEKTLYLAAFSNVTAITSGGALAPTNPPPTTWAAKKTMDSAPALSGIILLGYGYNGNVDFDEIRVGTSWEELVGKQTEPPQNVTRAEAWTDGNELVRIAWQYAGGLTNGTVINPLADGVKIYAKEGAGDWFEIYKGKGTNNVVAKDAWSRWDHVVLPGSTHEYKVVAYASSRYTNGVVAVNRDTSPATTVTTGVYGEKEYLETMSYTNSTAFVANAWKGGHGFGDTPSAWIKADDNGSWSAVNPEEAYETVHITDTVTGSKRPVGNVLKVTGLGDGKESDIYRELGGSAWCGNSGDTFYAAFRMAYQKQGYKRAALVLTDSGGNHVWVGKARGADGAFQKRLGIEVTGGSGAGWYEGDTLEPYGADDGGTAGNAYLIVVKMQRLPAAGRANISAWQYKVGSGSLPAEEPASQAFYGNAPLANVQKLEFHVGVSSNDTSKGSIGEVFFDDLRFGTTWEDIVGATEPEDVWTAGITAGAYKGDFATWNITSKPHGPKQSAWVVISSNDTTFANATVASNTTTWLRKVLDGDGVHWNSEWEGHELQFKGAGTWYGGGVVKGELVTVKSWERAAELGYRWNTYNVTNLPNPTKTNDVNRPPEVFTGDAKLGLAWAPATAGGRTFPEVMIVRFADGADAWSPTDGTVYMKGGAAGTGTVVYRGTNATTLVDKGLSTNATYRYQFYTVNNSYYSPGVSVLGATTTNAPPIEINGDPNDWIGEPSEVKNSSKLSPNGEWIWTDKVGDGRKDNNAAYDADITEFRIKVDSTNVYFMARLNCLTNPANPYIAVGIATNVDATRLALTGNDGGENWLGDESSTFMGGNLFSPASLHYADIQMTVHQVGGTWQIELYKKDSTSWYGPGGVGDVSWTVASSAAGAEDPCIEWTLHRSDLGLDFGSVTPARFTVASFVNSGGWNNDVVGTTKLSDGTSYAVDTLAIAPWGVNDKDLALTAWDEGIKNNNAEYWFDIWFGPTALHNSAPKDTVPLAPANDATDIAASPTMTWEGHGDGPDSDDSSYKGFVVGYLVEVSTNQYFNGLEGTMENGPVSCRVNVEGAETTSYRYITDSREYWWRVRARDNSGALSSPTVWHYTVQGKTDNEGPMPKLLYVGTNVMAFLTNETYRAEQIRSGDATSVLDSELEDGGHNFGFVMEWYDVNGVYATNSFTNFNIGTAVSGYTPTFDTEFMAGKTYYTNANGTYRSVAQASSATKNPATDGLFEAAVQGAFAFNVLAEYVPEGETESAPYGRVSPNWDLMIVDRAAPDTGPAPANEVVGGVSFPYERDLENGLTLPTDDGGTEIVHCWYIDCGLNRVFNQNQTINDGNDGQYLTNYVTKAFSIGNYRTSLDIYLTVSAEDCCTNGEYRATDWYSWPPKNADGSARELSAGNGPQAGTPHNGLPSWTSSGWCHDGPNPSRNVTTNRLLHIHVRDNDTIPPIASTAKWRASATNEAGDSLLPMVAVATGTTSTDPWDPTWDNLDRNGLTRLPTYDGQGKTLQWQLTDGDVADNGTWLESKKLNFFFNVYDEYLHSGMQTNTSASNNVVKAVTASLNRTNWMENTGMILSSPSAVWTNWAKYTAGLSDNLREGGSGLHGLGTDPNTVLAWTYDAAQTNVEALLGATGLLSDAKIGTNAAGDQLVVTNALKLFAWDSDNNAAGDQEGAELEFGQLIFTDDDATAPEVASFRALGTGTNYTHFGRLGLWQFGTDTNAPTFTTSNLTSALTLSSEVTLHQYGTSDPTRHWNKDSHVIYYNGAGGKTTDWDQTGTPYFEFTLAGDGRTTWSADMIGFENRTAQAGPTLYALTVQAPSLSFVNNAVEAGALNSALGWTSTGSPTVPGSGTYKGMINFTNDATASVSSTSIAVRDYSAFEISLTVYAIGRTDQTTGRTLTVQYQATGDADWNDLRTFRVGASGDFSGAGSSVDYSYDLSAVPGLLGSGKSVQVRVLASGTKPTQSFAVKDLKLTYGSGDGSEHVLGRMAIDKEMDANGEHFAQETVTSVIFGFDTPIQTSRSDTNIFRLYAFDATRYNSSGELEHLSDMTGTNVWSFTWGIRELFLHGTASEPKLNEVTDYDVAQGAWTNQLEVLDGAMAGYDTARSGLWVKDDGETGGTPPSFRILYPSYYDGDTHPYPNGSSAEVASGSLNIRSVADAEFDNVVDGDFNAYDPEAAVPTWNLSAGASVSGGRMTMASKSAASAWQTVTLSAMEGVKSVTVAGTVRAKGTLKAADGSTNTLTVTAEVFSKAGVSMTNLTNNITLNASMKNYPLGPWALAYNNAGSVKFTVAQTDGHSTELVVDELSAYVAQWGADIAEGDDEWATTVTNGMPAAKAEVYTPELDLDEVNVPLSDASLGGGASKQWYTLEATVHDHDHDRADDALAASASGPFWLYDDDVVEPQWGAKFDSPMGIFLNGNIVSLKARRNSGADQIWPILDSELTALGADDPVLFSLSAYDYSGWKTTSFAVGEETVQGASGVTEDAATAGWSQVASEGAAESPAATNTWSIGAKDLYTAHRDAFEGGEEGETLELTANATDLDADRKDDSLATGSSRVGYAWFADQDVSAPGWGSQTTPYYGLMISTGVGASAGLGDLLGTDESPAPYALGGATNNQGAFADRSYTVYDGQLKDAGESANQFVVTANLNDPLPTGDGARARHPTGLKRGSTLTESAAMWGDSSVAANVFTVTNTHLVIQTPWTGGEGSLTNVAFSEAFTDPAIGKTRINTQAGHTSWAWTFPTNDIGKLLPPNKTNALLTLKVEAYDADANRHNDQMHASLTGPTIMLRDDDTTAPTAPTDVTLTGLTVPSGTLTRDNAPWTNNLSGVKLGFTAATDPMGAAPDIKAAGVARYRLADPDATPGVEIGTPVQEVSDPSATSYGNLPVPSIDQGFGAYKLFAVDADADRPGDALPGPAATVPLAYDITKPTMIGQSAAARLVANPDDTDDPTTQFDLTWPTTGVGPDDPVEDAAHYEVIPQKYKDAATVSNDVLSPWATYKIYYTNYKESAIASDDIPTSETKSWVYTNFITTKAYMNWTSVTASASAVDPTAPTNSEGRSVAYASLGVVSNTSQKVRLYDLEFDQHYVVVIVGVDKAGNEGPAGLWSWATNNTIKFALTQGVVRVRSAINAAVAAGSAGTNSVGQGSITDTNVTHGAVLYWMAAGQTNNPSTHERTGNVSKFYDLIYRDAAGFTTEKGTEQWFMARSLYGVTNSGTSKTNWNYQTDGLEGISRTKLRFYRASYHDRWQTNNPTTGLKQRPLASEEVYSMNRVPLLEGVNLVGLQGVPYVKTLRGLFGTDWPLPTRADDSTRVEFFRYTNGVLVSATQAWFRATVANGVTNGYWADGPDSTHDISDDELPPGYFGKSFSITLPRGLSGRFREFETNAVITEHPEGGTPYATNLLLGGMSWYPILQVPTNGTLGADFSVEVAYGSVREPKYTLVSLNLPVAVEVDQLGLVQTNAAGEWTGFMPMNRRGEGDVLYTYDNETKSVREDSAVYYDAEESDAKKRWKWVTNNKEAHPVVRPNDAIVILSKGKPSTNSTWTWTYQPSDFYDNPTRWMGH